MEFFWGSLIEMNKTVQWQSLLGYCEFASSHVQHASILSAVQGNSLCNLWTLPDGEQDWLCVQQDGTAGKAGEQQN